MIPYEEEQVIEILIEGAPDWLPIVRGSYESVQVEFQELKRWGVKAVDKMDGSQVFLWGERLIAVKYTTEDQTASGISPADGRLLP